MHGAPRLTSPRPTLDDPRHQPQARCGNADWRGLALPAGWKQLRLLCQAQLDSHLLLTVILAGDRRLLQRLEADELLPLDSRIRVRLSLARASSEELLACLRHALSKAGAASLMTPELCATLCDHAAGNYRTLFNMAGELLAVAAHRDLDRLDEKLFLETVAAPPSDAAGAGRWR